MKLLIDKHGRSVQHLGLLLFLPFVGFVCSCVQFLAHRSYENFIKFTPKNFMSFTVIVNKTVFKFSFPNFWSWAFKNEIYTVELTNFTYSNRVLMILYVNLYVSNNYLAESLWLYMVSCHLQIDTIVLLLFLPFGCLLLLFLSDCYVLDFQYNAEQKYKSESRHPCPDSDLRGKSVELFTLSRMLAVDLS